MQKQNRIFLKKFKMMKVVQYLTNILLCLFHFHSLCNSRELTKMEKFQEEQKKIEEENAKRKSLLARAIADR